MNKRVDTTFDEFKMDGYHIETIQSKINQNQYLFKKQQDDN